MIIDEVLKREIVLNSFLQSHLKGLDEEKDKHLFVYDSETLFDDIPLYYDGDVNVNFCGVEFSKDCLTLKFYCFTMEEENTDIYIKNLKVNGQTMVNRKFMGSVNNCEYDYIYSYVRGTPGVAYADFSMIELELEV